MRTRNEIEKSIQDHIIGGFGTSKETEMSLMNIELLLDIRELLKQIQSDTETIRIRTPD